MSMRLADELEKRKNALTVRELALLLSLSEKLLYRLIRQGTLPALRVGASVRLDPTVTANWIRGARHRQMKSVAEHLQTSSVDCGGWPLSSWEKPTFGKSPSCAIKVRQNT